MLFPTSDNWLSAQQTVDMMLAQHCLLFPRPTVQGSCSLIPSLVFSALEVGASFFVQVYPQNSRDACEFVPNLFYHA